MKKNLILILAAAATAVGCAKSDSANTLDNDNQTPIAVMGQARDIVSASGRAPFEGDISNTNKLTALIPASLTDGDYTSQYALGTMTFGETSSAVVYSTEGFTGNKDYPANGETEIYLAGLYPATGWETVLSNTASITFTGKDDVMAAEQVTASKASTTAGTYPKMIFKHLLTKLEIKVVAPDAASSAAWGTIKEITLTKSQNATFKNVAEVTLKTGVAAFSGAATNWAVYNGDAAITSGAITIPVTDAEKVGYTIVAPITATAEADADFTIGIKTVFGSDEYSKDDISVTLKNTSGTDFSGTTAGKSFVVTLTFKGKDIQATASVTPWEDGGSADSEVN